MRCLGSVCSLKVVYNIATCKVTILPVRKRKPRSSLSSVRGTIAMNKAHLNLEMEHFASAGFTLSTEEQMFLKISLPVLKAENNFEAVAFWGKVFGSGGDYYVAQGRGKDYIRNRKRFYSIDGQKWRVLFDPSEADLKNFHLVKTRFTGDPMIYHYFVEPPEDSEKADMDKVMKEETRLSALVKLVDLDTDIAPKEAMALSPTGLVLLNDAFTGLSTKEALELDSYVHFRLPDCDKEMFPVNCFSSMDMTLDFLEPITNDNPLDCWTIEHDEAFEIVTLHNLWWTGMTFYHLPKQPTYGRIYFGYGDWNSDLPFMK